MNFTVFSISSIVLRKILVSLIESVPKYYSYNSLRDL
jgi:hypothetical protein